MTYTPPPSWLQPPTLGEAEELALIDFPTVLLGQTASRIRHQRIRPLLLEHGLGVPDYRLLALLAHYGRMSMPQICERSSADKSQISRVLLSLEKRGLVERSTQPSHVRRLWVDITTPGLQLYQEATTTVRTFQLELLNSLTLAERRSLYSALHKLMALAE